MSIKSVIKNLKSRFLKFKYKKQAEKLQDYAKHRQKEPAFRKKAENHYYPSDSEHRAAEQINWRSQNTISSFTLVAASLAAIFSGFTLYEAWVANQMNAESGRAWAAPGNISLSSPLTFAQGVNANASFKNVGKEPGTNLNIFVDVTNHSISDWNSGVSSRKINLFRKNCLIRDQVGEDQRVSYPSGADGPENITINTMSNTNRPKFRHEHMIWL